MEKRNMYLLKLDELKELLGKKEEHCITIYFPTHPTGTETRQDSIRLKNLLQKAKEQLHEKGVRSIEAEELLKPAQGLIENESFWLQGDEGMAIFLAKGYSKVLKLPQAFDELVAVNDQFHLKQLLPFFNNDRRFYILALSENHVRFLECTKYRCEPITIPGMPQCMEEALDYISPEQPNDLPFKGTGKDKGSQTILSGGHGGHRELNNERVLQYFRELLKYLNEYLHDDTAPLVLATVEEHYPIFREASGYKNLLEKFIKGNPERISDQDLHERTKEIVAEYFSQQEKESIDKYVELYGTPNTVHNVEDALKMAYQGRIDTLLVANSKERWGTFDGLTMEIEEHEEQQSGDHDLIDKAATFTVQNDGKVFVIDADKIPKGMEIAGILRF